MTIQIAEKDTRLVGNSFKMGYRFQNYWGDSMAVAFFSAEVGAGTFLVSYYYDLLLGMVLGVVLAGTLKPYFHLAHMGVPKKSMRALLRPDRSWISRGAIAIGLFIGPAIFYLLNQGGLFQFASLSASLAVLDVLAEYTALIAALVVITYQGFAMSHSESFTLWASPLLPISSAVYALTAGCLLSLVIGWNYLEVAGRDSLAFSALLFLGTALLVVMGILVTAKNKSHGGAFSVELLMKTHFASPFRHLSLHLGLVLPLVIMLVAEGYIATLIAAILMLIGFITFRIMLFRAAVFEPISHDIAGRFGLV